MTEVRYLGLNLSWMIPATEKQGDGPVGSLADLNGHLLCDINLTPGMRSRLAHPDSDRRWLDYRQSF
ncbi:hypothetical protein [Phyllobacterium myrsinacearum]|uniref:Uncharacterized protein n=1 Tax=Phyllobacterium myrsinacearum TaxID=28101 RepID=A0A839ETH8_9HYPH|nr:hypothetical protein [Phyllobacterium myrsinacearum]MBA8880814.1 hypothetical protein [Phyllobacterium myrsinacearum]